MGIVINKEKDNPEEQALNTGERQRDYPGGCECESREGN